MRVIIKSPVRGDFYFTCKNCDKVVRTGYLASFKRKFCSQSCAQTYNQKDGGFTKNRNLSEEHKRKIGKSSKGRFLGDKNPSKRKEVRKKISYSIKKLFEDPTKNPMYIDGRSFKKYSFEFRRRIKYKIRKRDNFTCQHCGIEENKQKLDVHHKDENTNNNDFNNLISLCRSCHMKEHHCLQEEKK